MTYRTTVDLSGMDKVTGEAIIVRAGAKLSDIYEAGHQPCLDPDPRPTRFVALAHVDGRRVSLALNIGDFVIDLKPSTTHSETE